MTLVRELTADFGAESVFMEFDHARQPTALRDPSP